MSPDYQLWHGDCLQEMDRVESGSVDMILADLPYGTTACVWDTRLPFEPLWAQYKRVIKRNRAIVLFGSQPFTSMLVMSNLEWFKYEWIWDKISKTDVMNAKNKPLKEHENIIIFSSGTTANCSFRKMDYYPQDLKPATRENCNNRKAAGYMGSARPSHPERYICQSSNYPGTILRFTNAVRVNVNHPTQKPIALLRYLIRTYSNEGDLILDNCAGSGSTLEAAMRENRRSIGIELYPLPDKPIGNDNPDYFGIATKRLENVARELKGEWKPLQDTGGSFEGLPLFESIQ